jgi:hypothetical protein
MMKIKTKFIITTFTLLFSFNVSAHLLEYVIDLNTIAVEGPAFGGVSVGDTFQGALAIDTHVLQEIVDADGGFPTVFVPLQDEDDNFNLSYSVNVGDYSYTEQTAGSFDAEFTVDDPANVEDVTGFSLDIGDLLSFNDLAVGATNGMPMTGSWSATDGISGNVVSGDITVSAVPVPAAAWLFASGLLSFAGLKRKKTRSTDLTLIAVRI